MPEETTSTPQVTPTETQATQTKSSIPPLQIRPFTLKKKSSVYIIG